VQFRGERLSSLGDFLFALSVEKNLCGKGDVCICRLRSSFQPKMPTGALRAFFILNVTTGDCSSRSCRVTGSAIVTGTPSGTILGLEAFGTGHDVSLGALHIAPCFSRLTDSAVMLGGDICRSAW
jgi:hypothetical protein